MKKLYNGEGGIRKVRREWLFRIVMATSVCIICFIVVEYGLRAIKSLTSEGTLYLATPSINSRLHPKYGWLSPPSLRFEKSDTCYGQGAITYNEAGFRAPALSEASNADILICILGDSTMQGYQIPDGKYLPHLLKKELQQKFENPYVLPLAVGGFGSLQEWMLFEDYCRPLNPTIVIWHWSSNDITNNNYFADRYSGPNNVRPRPYFENNQIVIRRPYPLRINDRIDGLMTLKIMNGLLLKWDARSPEDLKFYNEMGWQVAEQMVARVGTSVETKIALVEAEEKRAIEMFRAQGFWLAIYDPFTPEQTCLPRDPHPNPKGHQHMLRALLPVLNDRIDALSQQHKTP